MKWCKSGLHFTEKDRFMIQKIWNTPDHLPHASVREAAKRLGLSEATLLRELKRGCAEGKYSMRLKDGPEIKWQYFPYHAAKAIQDAREKASHKGPKMKLMASHVNMIKEFLVAWHSIPAAYAKMILEHPESRFPCLRTFVYHAQNGEWRTTVGEIECFKPYGSRKIPDEPAEEAKNHDPTLRIHDLPEEVKSIKCKKFAQMDTVHSGSK